MKREKRNCHIDSTRDQLAITKRPLGMQYLTCSSSGWHFSDKAIVIRKNKIKVVPTLCFFHTVTLKKQCSFIYLFMLKELRTASRTWPPRMSSIKLTSVLLNKETRMCFLSFKWLYILGFYIVFGIAFFFQPCSCDADSNV